MGRDISWSEFSDEDFKVFKKRLRDESCLLMQWFRNQAFATGPPLCGFELEAWLTGPDHAPSPTNERFLDEVPSPLVVPELARFNFEINSTPLPVQGSMLSSMERELTHVWELCRTQARLQGAGVAAIGILPTVTQAMLHLNNMSPLSRYQALNQQVMRLRGKQPMRIHIDGPDPLKVEHHDVMMESVATSLQIHLQMDPGRVLRGYNAAQALSAPMVAVAANSPYLFGRELWDETRIPLFEQAVSVASFRDLQGVTLGRVTFGSGFCRESILELFLENLHGFPVLLPMVFDEDPHWLSHLRLHNGTIWRWNRPLIGLAENGAPHLRIEHRTPAAGPSIPDTIANIGLFAGLMMYYSNTEAPLEMQLPFTAVRDNFYQAARHGLAAKVRWTGDRDWDLSALLEKVLIPAAREGLLQAELDPADVEHYLDEIMQQRVRTRRNGAWWQRAYIARNGPDFAAMTHAYMEHQQQNRPVHEWEV